MAKVKCEPAFSQFDKVNVREPRKLTVDGAEVETINPDHFTAPIQASYDSPNSFSMTGNQTEDFQIGRRVQLDSGQSDLTCNKPIFDLTPDDVFTANKYDYSIISDVAFDGVTTDVTMADNIVTPKLEEASVDINWSSSQAGLITTTDLINSSQGYPSDYVLETSGFTTSGDGGGGQWKQNGVIAQPPSQTPSQLGDALLNDASGNQWSLAPSGWTWLAVFGAVNGAVSTLSIQAAINSGIAITDFSGSEFLTGQLSIPSNRYIEGNFTVKLIDGTDLSTVRFVDDSEDITLKGFTINGNKLNQTAGVASRGLYALGETKNINLHSITVYQSLDHGIMFSGGGVQNITAHESLIFNCKAIECGRPEHQAAGGAGGSGFNGGSESTVWNSCYSRGNELNGMKTGGKMIACISEENSSGFETGFTTGSGTSSNYSYVDCIARRNTGSGFRSQGVGVEYSMIGCVSEVNGGPGLIVINDVYDLGVIGCTFRDNGETGVRGPTGGKDGITIEASSGSAKNIVISDSKFISSLGFQEFGIYTNVDVDEMKISDSNVFTISDSNSPLHFTNSALGSNISIGNCTGLDTYKTAPTFTTSLTTEQTVADFEVRANQNVQKNSLNFSFIVKPSGDVGTIRFKLNSTTIKLSSALADGSTTKFDFTIDFFSTRTVMTNNTTGLVSVITDTNRSFANAYNLTLTAKVNNGTGSISVYNTKLRSVST